MKVRFKNKEIRREFLHELMMVENHFDFSQPAKVVRRFLEMYPPDYVFDTDIIEVFNPDGGIPAIDVLDGLTLATDNYFFFGDEVERYLEEVK